MTPLETLVQTIARLQREDLDHWIAQEFITPDHGAGGPVFADAECARVRLLCTLHYELEVDAEALPVILSLLDQLYDTRAALRALSDAVAAQPPEIRRAILAALEVETLP